MPKSMLYQTGLTTLKYVILVVSAAQPGMLLAGSQPQLFLKICCNFGDYAAQKKFNISPFLQVFTAKMLAIQHLFIQVFMEVTGGFKMALNHFTVIISTRSYKILK